MEGKKSRSHTNAQGHRIEDQGRQKKQHDIKRSQLTDISFGGHDVGKKPIISQTF